MTNSRMTNDLGSFIRHSSLVIRHLAPCPSTSPARIRCLKRFSVADKFAGQKGPCPKCKTIITIPKKEEEVIIHSPEHSEAGAIGVGGRHALKTYRRSDTKFKPLVFTGVVGFVLVALLIALVRSQRGTIRRFG